MTIPSDGPVPLAFPPHDGSSYGLAKNNRPNHVSTTSGSRYIVISTVMDESSASARLKDLYRSWGPSVLRYAATLTHSVNTAEDLVHEAFMALQGKWLRGESVENPRAWTIATVRNLAHKERRRQSRLVEFPCDDFAAAPSRDDVLMLGKLLARLTEREQEVLLLRMDSLDYKEIARELGIARGTVSALIARALAKLREAAGTERNRGTHAETASR